MRGKLFCIAAAALLVAGFGNVWAEEIDWDVSYSGSYFKTSIDTNGDGGQANHYLVWTKGNGAVAQRGFFEVVVNQGPVCPEGYVSYAAVLSTMVTRFSNGDLLFSRVNPGQGGGCLNATTGVGQGTVFYTILGGTGKYSGASGTFQDNLTIVTLIPTPTGDILHAAIFGTQTGTVYTAGD